MRALADSTTMLIISRFGMAFGVPVIMSMMVWVLSSVNSMQIDIGVMKNQISAGIEDRYHGSDAVKDFALRDFQINRNAEDIAKLYDGQKDLRARVDLIERSK